MSKSEFSTFFKFVSSIEDPDKRETFLKALSESEKIDFSSSLEEFRAVFDRVPEGSMMGKPDKAKDVTFSEVKEVDIRKRFEEVMETFPQRNDVEGLRNLSQLGSHPKSGFKSFRELKEHFSPDVVVTEVSIKSLRDKVKEMP